MQQSNRIIGTVRTISPVLTDPNNIGTWKRKDIIVEIQDSFKTIACFTLWNTYIEKFNVKLNEKVEISFNVISRLRNDGKYYTDLNVYNIKSLSIKTSDFQNKTTPVVSPTPEEVEKSKEFEDDFHF